MPFLTENTQSIHHDLQKPNNKKNRSLRYGQKIFNDIPDTDELKQVSAYQKQQLKSFSHHSLTSSKRKLSSNKNSINGNFFKTTNFQNTLYTKIPKETLRHNISWKDSNRKWKQIVDIFNCLELSEPIEIPQKFTILEQFKCQTHKNKEPIIKSGLNFHKMLAEYILKGQKILKINFPQTLIDLGEQLLFIWTNLQNNCVCHKKISKNQSHSEMMECIQKNKQLLKKYPSKYREIYDYSVNQQAPVIVTKYSQDYEQKFDIDIQSYKLFIERRSRPNQNKIIQRYIYPHSSKAMVFRIYYHKKKQREQRQQFYGIRFINTDSIFQNKRNQVTKFQATVCPIYERIGKIEMTKIKNVKSLQKYIIQTKQLIQFLEYQNKVKISQISIDFIVDVFDRAWMIGINRCQATQISSLNACLRNNSHNVLGKSSVCRVCSNIYAKDQLKKTISNKILMQFLTHLRKRMTIQEYKQLSFAKQISNIHLKSHISFHVCDYCYQLISEEFKLIECERKLAAICSIKPAISNSMNYSQRSNDLSAMYQWRLMIFLVDVINLPPQFYRTSSNFFIKYSLGNQNQIEQSWKIKREKMKNGFYNSMSQELLINKVKVHYFYSTTTNIDSFLKDTQLSLQLGSPQNKSFSKGSSGIISAFRHRMQGNLCLRQTSSALLFYTNGKYCELTVKIGLICDGLYQITNQNLFQQVNGVYFRDKNFTNSNPIPKQWMEAFGIDDELQLCKNKQKEELLTQNKNKSGNINIKKSGKLQKKSLHMF